jgi:hypothetical protein
MIYDFSNRAIDLASDESPWPKLEPLRSSAKRQMIAAVTKPGDERPPLYYEPGKS